MGRVAVRGVLTLESMELSIHEPETLVPVLTCKRKAYSNFWVVTCDAIIAVSQHKKAPKAGTARGCILLLRTS